MVLSSSRDFQNWETRCIFSLKWVLDDTDMVYFLEDSGFPRDSVRISRTTGMRGAIDISYRSVMRIHNQPLRNLDSGRTICQWPSRWHSTCFSIWIPSCIYGWIPYTGCRWRSWEPAHVHEWLVIHVEVQGLVLDEGAEEHAVPYWDYFTSTSNSVDGVIYIWTRRTNEGDGQISVQHSCN